MRPSSWQLVRRLLAVFPGDVDALPAVLQQLHQHLPEAEITLLVPPLDPATSLQVDNPVLVHPAVYDCVTQAPLQDFITMLRPHQFDGAVIFTRTSQSPYPLAYACYLAGIPLRLGQSQEFGGSVLSHWIKSSAQQVHDLDYYLFLLEQGLSTDTPSLTTGRGSR